MHPLSALPQTTQLHLFSLSCKLVFNRLACKVCDDAAALNLRCAGSNGSPTHSGNHTSQPRPHLHTTTALELHMPLTLKRRILASLAWAACILNQ